MIMNKEIVNKDKALDIALKIASDRENYFDRLEEGLYGLSLEEQNLVLALTYIVLLSRQFGMPKELIKGQMNKINTKVQRMAKDNQQFKEYSKRQIEMIKPTNQLRTDFTHQIYGGHFMDALITACKLLDIYEFGIAGSTINQELLEKAMKKYNVQMD